MGAPQSDHLHISIASLLPFAQEVAAAMVGGIEQANGVATMDFDKGVTNPATRDATDSAPISAADMAPVVTDWRELTEAVEVGAAAASAADSYLGTEASGKDSADSEVNAQSPSLTNINGDNSSGSSGPARPSFPVDPDQDVIQIMAVCAFKDANGYLPVAFKLLATGDLPVAKLGHGGQGYYERGQRADDTAGSVNKEDLELSLKGKKADGGDPGSAVEDEAGSTASAIDAAASQTGSTTASSSPHHLKAAAMVVTTAASTAGPIQEFVCQLKAPTAGSLWPGPSVSEVTLGIAATFASRARPRPNLVFETQLPPLNEVNFGRMPFPLPSPSHLRSRLVRTARSCQCHNASLLLSHALIYPPTRYPVSPFSTIVFTHSGY